MIVRILAIALSILLAGLPIWSWATVVTVTPFLYPFDYRYVGDVSNSNTLDNAADRHALIFKAPATCSATKVGFSTRTVTSSQSVDVRIETVDGTSGDPSGTLIDSPTNQAYGTEATLASNTYYEPTLTAAQSLTAGTTYAVVIQYTSTAGTIQTLNQSIDTSTAEFPYASYNLTGSYAKSASTILNIVLYCGGAYYELGTMPPLSSATLSAAYNSGSTPDERGNKITFPVPVKVDGFWAMAGGAAGGTWDFVLYDSDGTTALKTISFDGDQRGNGTTRGKIYVRWGSPISLSANTAYRVVIKPTNTTNVTLYQFTVNSTAILDAYSGGSAAFLTTRVDAAGSWTDTATTTRAMVGLIVTGLDNGA